MFKSAGAAIALVILPPVPAKADFAAEAGITTIQDAVRDMK